jgi:hypothetical protein
MYKSVVLGAVVALATAASGCGPNCQSTCNALYQDIGSGGCDIQSPGSSRSELIQLCLDECEAALLIPGDVGDYNPLERTPSNVSVSLDNDRQAAVWMECIAETSCEFLDDGYCEPVW